jgi:predicted ATPase
MIIRAALVYSVQFFSVGEAGMNEKYISRLALENFTAFRNIDITFSPGVNVLIGKNGTGKTHILKVLYSACDVTITKKLLAEKILPVFLPYHYSINRLVSRKPGNVPAKISIFRGDDSISLSFFKKNGKWTENGSNWYNESIECVYIPVKEMLSSAPGFRSLFNKREIHFEEIYPDIIDRAFIPPLKESDNSVRKKILTTIEKAIEGKVVTKGEQFFLKNSQGLLEFDLLAEGIRKLALLLILIQNGTLSAGSVLFWDEPETNLNPAVMRTVVEILITLQRLGVQIFIATHDYVILKEFDLQMKPQDKIMFHAFYHDSGEVKVSSTESYIDIDHNAISETFLDLYDRDIERALKEK